MSQAVYIVSGARTPQGSFMGALSGLTAPELGGVAIEAAVQRSGVSVELLDAVLMGCVLTAGIGQAPARQAALKAGLPTSVGATTVGKVCGSGMQAVIQGRQAILAGDAHVVVAGGMESMSQVPHLLKPLRKGAKMGHQTLLDAMIFDGLWDPYGDMHMGNCAEKCVEQYGFTRAVQDAFARQSFERALEAQKMGSFHTEIAPVSIPQRGAEPLVVSEDEGPGKVKLDKIATLSLVFDKNGAITAANASSINDGAAALVLAGEDAVQAHGLKPLARIVSVATHSQDPLWFTTAPVGAIQKALDKAGLSVADIDCFEINEAFAVVALYAIETLGLDPAKVNPRGGGLSLGHPIGATGARLLVTLLHTLQQTQGKYGVASLCIGGGEATAVVLEVL